MTLARASRSIVDSPMRFAPIPGVATEDGVAEAPRLDDAAVARAAERIARLREAR